MRLEDLRHADLDRLHEMYDSGEVPEEDEVMGDMRGAVLAGRGVGRTELWKRVSRYLPWAGMRIEDGEGINHLGYSPLVVERYGFEKYVERGREGGALVLDYDVRENPYWLRRLTERVRKIEDGLLLGKASLSVGGREVFVHYYAMEPEDSEIPVESGW